MMSSSTSAGLRLRISRVVDVTCTTSDVIDGTNLVGHQMRQQLESMVWQFSRMPFESGDETGRSEHVALRLVARLSIPTDCGDSNHTYLGVSIENGDDDPITRTPQLTTMQDVALWSFERIGGGVVRFVSVSPLCPFSFAANIEIVFPPVIDIAPLLVGTAASREAEFRQLRCMQEILDAAQDVGYFFIKGCEVLQERATRVLRVIADNVSKAEQQTKELEAPIQTLQKSTLVTSTGLVKVSSVPPVHLPVVPPRWLSEAALQHCLLPYYEEAKRVSMLLMETLAQDDVDPLDLYFLLRSLVYPPLLDEGVSRSDVKSEKEADSYSQRYLEPHSDKSWITILITTDVGGLEYVGAAGDDSDFAPAVHPSLSHLVPTIGVDDDFVWPLVNIGDAFQMLSQGQFLSRIHRAKNAASNDGDTRLRVSVPLFVEPRPDKWPQPYVTEQTLTIDL